jgi:hypothetical protein
MGFHFGTSYDHRVGHNGAVFQIFRYVAAVHQYRNDHCYVPYGLPHSEHAEPGNKNCRLEAGRVAAGGGEGARTSLVQLDHMSDIELEIVQEEFSKLREKYAPLIDDDLTHVEREIRVRKKRE